MPNDAPPPDMLLMQLITGHWLTQSIGVAAVLGVPDALAGGPLDYRAIAEKVHSHPQSTYRLLRALTVPGVLSEPTEGSFALTPMGEMLRSDHPSNMRYTAIFHSQHNYGPWGSLLHSVRTGEIAFQKVTGQHFFHYLKTTEAGASFDRMMTAVSVMVTQAVVQAYDFNPFPVIADVGGGFGTFLAQILRAAPASRGILTDVAEILAGSKDVLAKYEVADRVTVTPMDFFKSAPKADAYLMKHIIHDWSDEECVQILKNIRAQAQPGAVVLAVDVVIPEPNQPHFGKMLDLEMLVDLPGRERTAKQFGALFEQAGFQMTRVIPIASFPCIVEAKAV